MENNRLIAEFMGWKNHPEGSREFYVPEELVTYMYSKDMNLEDLKFHESWDWLMPVASKINDISVKDTSDPNYKVDKSNCFGSIKYSKFADVLFFNPGTSIEKYYNYIVEFIKWYNKNNDETDT